jgi:uncharacterized membrane protein YbhN (UPF0104 family)
MTTSSHAEDARVPAEPEPGAASAQDAVAPRARAARRLGILGWAVGIGLLVGLAGLLHLSVGWEALLAPWREVSAREMAVAFSLVVASYAIRAVRVHRYFLPVTRAGFLRALRLTLVHNLLNNLLPARSGEASFPILMKREFGVPLARSIPALLYFRFLDLHFLLALGTGVLLASRGAGGWLLAAALVPLPWVVFQGQGWLAPRVGPGRGRIRRLAGEALAGLPGSARLFWETWAWTAVNWGAKLLAFAWVLRAFLPMPYAASLLGSVTGELSSVLPIHGLAGAGTYEGGILAGLLPLGIGAEAALRAAVNLHLFVLGVSFLSAILGLLLPAVPARRPDRQGPRATHPTPS